MDQRPICVTTTKRNSVYEPFNSQHSYNKRPKPYNTYLNHNLGMTPRSTRNSVRSQIRSTRGSQDEQVVVKNMTLEAAFKQEVHNLMTVHEFKLERSRFE